MNKDLLDLTAEMYEAAALVTGPGWQSVYERLSQMLSAGPGSIHFFNKRNEVFEPFAHTYEPGFIDRFNKHYFPIHPARKKILSLKPGQNFIRSRDCPDEVYTTSDAYREFLKKYEIDFVFRRRLYDSPQSSIGVTFSRPRRLNPFGDKEIALFDSVSGHLMRALELFVQVRQASTGNRLAVDVLDNLPYGAVILSCAGKVIFSNPAARSYLAAEPFILDRNASLSLIEDHLNRKFRSLMNGVFDAAAKGGAPFNGSMHVKRRTLPALKISISPFVENVFGGHQRKYALLLISDLVADEEASRSLLRFNYQLTDAEIGLALLLAKGHSMKEIAKLLRITQNTARTHLKRIFGKTSTNRQSSLVRLILAGETRPPDL